MTTDKKARKETPIARGFLDYFPDAVAAVANVSYIGNQQHNPGQELHWAREKSTDHADCVARHLIERGKIDDDGVRHTAKAAWRIMALLQLEIEQARADFRTIPLNEVPSLDGGPSDPDVGGSFALYEYNGGTTEDAERLNAYLIKQDEVRHEQSGLVVRIKVRETDTEEPLTRGVFDEETDRAYLLGKGCNPAVVEAILSGTTYQNTPNSTYIYIAGPMRGKPDFNFAAFDAERDKYASEGWNVISPADIDRTAGYYDTDDQSVYVYRDLYALLLVAQHDGGIHMLAGHKKSTGATAELALAKWLGIPRLGEIE